MELVARHDHGLAAASQELQQEFHDLPPHVRVHLQIDIDIRHQYTPVPSQYRY